MRWAAIAAATIAGVIDVLYLGIVGSQGAGDAQFLRVPFVATFIALMAICPALSVRASAARWRPLFLGLSAAGLLLLGFFAIFSIGLALLVAGALALFSLINALSQASRKGAVGMAVGGALLAVVVLVAGFTLTELVVQCPASGVMSGGGTSLLGAPYQYNCVDGKLTVSR